MHEISAVFALDGFFELTGVLQVVPAVMAAYHLVVSSRVPRRN
jgi:hypothetical protein